MPRTQVVTPAANRAAEATATSKVSLLEDLNRQITERFQPLTDEQLADKFDQELASERENAEWVRLWSPPHAHAKRVCSLNLMKDNQC